LGRLLVRRIIDELRTDGVTVFLNSDRLGEVEATCDRVAFVKRGRVVAEHSLSTSTDALDLALRVGWSAGASATTEILEGLPRFGTNIVQPRPDLIG
jgi:ABC-2 type transport system ATP-binding protein